MLCQLLKTFLIFLIGKQYKSFQFLRPAMLLAGIDPYDFENGLDEVKTRRHERWKMAWGISEGIISAIRLAFLHQCNALQLDG